MKKQIFTVGDRVFDAAFGWGEVFSYDTDSYYPVIVNFDIGGRKAYTWDGRLNRIANPTLSFTEYTLQGFTQERQIKFPCAGAFGIMDYKFGICIRKDSNGRYIEEDGKCWDFFFPMTFEEYCKLKNIEL